MLPLSKPGDPEGVLMEVGANIGACTVELLLRTRAKIIALEPSAANAYFLTRSLRLLAAQYPSVRDRVVVFPVGISDVAVRSPMLVPITNLGNSMMQPSSTEMDTLLTSELRGAATLEAVLLPLQVLFPHGLGRTRIVKIDTQGFECKVVQGAWGALQHPSTRYAEVVVAEVARQHLHAHCCSPAVLVHLMRMIGVPQQQHVHQHVSAGVSSETPGWPTQQGDETRHRSSLKEKLKDSRIVPLSNAIGLYAKQLSSAGPSSARAWNVSCDSQGNAHERTCLARPWHESTVAESAAPAPYQLSFERYERPLSRAKIRYHEWKAVGQCKRYNASGTGIDTAH